MYYTQVMTSISNDSVENSPSVNIFSFFLPPLCVCVFVEGSKINKEGEKGGCNYIDGRKTFVRSCTACVITMMDGQGRLIST